MNAPDPGGGGGGGDGGGDGGGGGSIFLPDWLEPIYNASVAGVRLRDNPFGFIIGTVVVWSINTVFGVLGAIERQLDIVGASLTASLREAGVAVLSSFGAAGDPILIALSELDALLYSIAFESAPAAVIMLPVVWVSTVVGVALAIRVIVFFLPVG